MKKYFIIIALLVVAASLYILFGSKEEGRVLGLSVNNFYSEKGVDINGYPVKKKDAGDPNIYSKSAVLIEDKTKYPLYLFNEKEPVPIASITKVMTACVVLDNYNMGDKVTVDEESANIYGSVIGLKPGEEITVKDLLYGMLMPSGNDAAFTLARHGQTVEDFVKLMNNKSAELGLRDTVFFGPAGLDDRGRSSAHDVAILFSHALNYDLFKEIVSTGEADIYSTDGQIQHHLKNSNRLTTQEIPMDGIIGGKTGFTLDAGHTLVSAAERNGVRLISVILNTTANTKTASAYESKKLLDWGFDSYDFQQI